MPFDLVIACDWSSEKGRKPTPGENRCWLSWATRDDPPDRRPDPEYMPTRLEAEARVRELLTGHAGARCLAGFDFCIGYPLTVDGAPVLSIGRNLCSMIAGRISDDPSGVNNRFEVADQLNREIRAATNAERGPYWGRPRELSHLGDLPERQPTGGTNIERYRAVEGVARGQSKQKPQSAWKLWTTGNVGSQTLMGLPTVHRLLTDAELAPRSHLWPFEPAPDRSDAITVAEIYPSLFPERAPKHWYKDARQVTDSRNAMMELDALPQPRHPRATLEGWIVGVEG
ncbi:MAG: hypothetical protein AAFX79_00760 [Planctomycetota bacterium]